MLVPVDPPRDTDPTGAVVSRDAAAVIAWVAVSDVATAGAAAAGATTTGGAGVGATATGAIDVATAISCVGVGFLSLPFCPPAPAP